MCAETADNHSYTHKCKPSISMLTAAVQPSPSERREIDILLLFVVLQKEAETEEHFIKNTTRIYRAAAGGAVRRSHPCTQDSVWTLIFLRLSGVDLWRSWAFILLKGFWPYLLELYYEHLSKIPRWTRFYCRRYRLRFLCYISYLTCCQYIYMGLNAATATSVSFFPVCVFFSCVYFWCFCCVCVIMLPSCAGFIESTPASSFKQVWETTVVANL